MGKAGSGAPEERDDDYLQPEEGVSKMLRDLNDRYDDWLDGLICRHPLRLIGGLLAFWLVVIVFVTGVIVHWSVRQSLEAQLNLQEYHIRTLQEQQAANQKDLNYLGDELFRMRRMQGWPSR